MGVGESRLWMASHRPEEGYGIYSKSHGKPSDDLSRSINMSCSDMY